MRIVVAAFAVLLVGCPADRTAIKTMHGSPADLRLPMAGPPPRAIAIIGDLRTPESALYDPQQDVYFISNINGSMTAIDGNGFISRVNPATMEVNIEWIRGLDAPKGMAVLGDSLYVADIRGVRKFDRRTGAAEATIELKGATFLNDIATDGKRLYVSDTGIALGPGPTFIPTGTDSIWTITNDRAEKLASGDALQQPNGLDVVDGALRVVTFSGNQMYELIEGTKKNIETLPAGQLDGLAHVDSETAIISSWGGDEIFRRERKGVYVPILGGVDAAADLGYDSKRKRLLVPIPALNQVTVHALQ